MHKWAGADDSLKWKLCLQYTIKQATVRQLTIITDSELLPDWLPISLPPLVVNGLIYCYYTL